MHQTVEAVTRRIIEQSKASRQAYLEKVEQAKGSGVFRNRLPCSNLAHDLAGCPTDFRSRLLDDSVANIGIITSYNDMVSAHQPYGAYPEIIKQAVNKAGATAQVAGGVPAMCDGVTQGEPGMDMSLISRDVQLERGDVLITSPLDAALSERPLVPPGLPLATVTRAEPDRLEPLFQAVAAAPRVNPRRLEVVEVIVPQEDGD